MGVDSSGYAMFGALTNHDAVIRANNTEYLRVLTGGNVQIRSGALQMNSTTVIDASRNITGAQINATTLIVNSGTANVVASFISTDATAGIKLQDNNGNCELSTSGGGFNVQPSGSTAALTVNSSGTTILVTGAANKGVLQLSSQASTYQLLGGNNLGYLGYKTGGYHRWFGSDGSEDMRLDSTGLNISVGTLEMGNTTVIDSARNITAVGGGFSGFLSNAGGAKLEIQNGSDGGNSRGIFMWTSTDTNWGIYMSTAGGGKSLSGGTASSGLDGRTSHGIRFRVANSSTQIGFLFENASEQALAQITADSGNFLAKGNVTAYASDARLKTNVKPIENALEKLNKIRGVEYDWVDNITSEYDFHPSVMHETGVIAQEIQAVIPDAVTTAPMNANYTTKCGTDHKFLTVQKDKIVPLLIEAVKEQQKEIDELKLLVKQLLER
jgi:hypothetical protein